MVARGDEWCGGARQVVWLQGVAQGGLWDDETVLHLGGDGGGYTHLHV